MLTDEKPTYLEGEEFVYDYLESNVTWEEIIKAQPYTATEDKGVRTVMRKDGEGRTFIYAVNLGKETTIEFQVKGATSFEWYDIFADEYIPMSTRVHFDEGQSYLLYLSDKKPVEFPTRKPLYLGEKFTVVNPVDNYITLDFIRFSTDGVNYSEPLHHMGVFDEMLQRRYKGKLYLKYEFTVDEIPEECFLFAEDTNTESVSVNGQIVENCGSSDYEKALYKYDVAKLLKKGINEVTIVIEYYQGENVYYALFGENVTESLKNCLAYDTDIEAIYLKGKFGVYGEFEQGNQEKVLLGQNFRIGKQNVEVTSLIDQGFPFFSGDITLKQTVTVEDSGYELIVDKSYHLIDVKVNGEYAGRMMFGKRLDLSKFLKAGENELEITLTVGNRNLLGAFHTLEQESTGVGPHTFERTGTWTNGKSSIFRDSYALVKTIL